MKVYLLIDPCADSFYEEDGKVLGIYGSLDAAQRAFEPDEYQRSGLGWLTAETARRVYQTVGSEPEHAYLFAWEFDSDRIDDPVVRIEEHEVQE